MYTIQCTSFSWQIPMRLLLVLSLAQIVILVLQLRNRANYTNGYSLTFREQRQNLWVRISVVLQAILSVGTLLVMWLGPAASLICYTSK